MQFTLLIVTMRKYSTEPRVATATTSDAHFTPTIHNRACGRDFYGGTDGVESVATTPLIYLQAVTDGPRSPATKRFNALLSPTETVIPVVHLGQLKI